MFRKFVQKSFQIVASTMMLALLMLGLMNPSASAAVPECFEGGPVYLHSGPNPYLSCTIPPGYIKVSAQCNSDGDEGSYLKLGWTGRGNCQFKFNGGTCNAKTKDFTYNPPIYGQPDYCYAEETQTVTWLPNGSDNGSIAIQWNQIP